MTEQYFTPEKINEFFVEIAGLPHCSGNEYAVYEYVIETIREQTSAVPEKLTIASEILNKETWKNAGPGERVIVLRREASRGMENEAKVILQGHMDMVCVAPHGKHPWEMPLQIFDDAQLETKVLKRGGDTEETGGTLGADDGIGISTALAIITDTSGQFLPEEHGMVECLFTVQEETNMGGARGFNPDLLQGDILINIDSETYDVITYGSAGGSGVQYLWVPILEEIEDTLVTAEISLKGLAGGHSGVDIDEGKGNALKITAQLLRWLREVKKLEARVISFNAGTASNAIPNRATLSVAFAGNFEDFESWCDSFLNAQKTVYQSTDPDMKWNITHTWVTGKALDTVSTHSLVDRLMLIPTGPVKMLSAPDSVVETSVNLAMITLDAQQERGKVSLTCSNRSASTGSLSDVEAIHQHIASLFSMPMAVNTDTEDADDVLKDDFKMQDSGMLVISGNYPGWMPNEKSKLLSHAVAVYHDAFPQIPENELKEVIHAGLECGWFIQRFTRLNRPIDCISIGPTIVTPHTWNERLVIDTVPIFVKNLTQLIKTLWNPTAV